MALCMLSRCSEAWQSSGIATTTTDRRTAVSEAILNLRLAQEHAMAIRPKVGGFPYLAEALRNAGVIKNVWFLPACESLYLTNKGPVVVQGVPLLTGPADVPPFDREALIAALRADQAGDSTFPEFLDAAWRAGVIRYEVDFRQRAVCYHGCNDEVYMERYQAVALAVRR